MPTATQKEARLVLEDGSSFTGQLFGAPVSFAGEVGEYCILAECKRLLTTPLVSFDSPL